MFNAFVSTFEVAFHTVHGQNKTRRFYTEGFIPVYSLCVVVVSPSLFANCLIGRTGNILSVVHIQLCTLMQNVYFCHKSVHAP